MNTKSRLPVKVFCIAGPGNTAEGLPDCSGYPAEGLAAKGCGGVAAESRCIADSKVKLTAPYQVMKRN